MKRAVLINADLDGWMDPPSSPTPPPSPVSPAPTPPRRRRPAGILLHTDGLQSANGWLPDRKVEDCQISDLLGKNEGRNLNTAPACLEPNSQETPGNRRKLWQSAHWCCFYEWALIISLIRRPEVCWNEQPVCPSFETFVYMIFVVFGQKTGSWDHFVEADRKTKV